MINRKPRHPGALIKRQYLEPLKLTISEFAERLGVTSKTLEAIVNENASVTPEMALRLSVSLSTTPELWLNLQKNYDLWVAAHESEDWKLVKPLSLETNSAS